MPSEFADQIVRFHHGGELLACSRMNCPSEHREQLDKAWALIADGRFRDAELLLYPLAEIGNPEAEYLLSGFSLDGENEAVFEERCLRMLEISAAKDYPPAVYELGVSYDTGDLVSINKEKAAHLFEHAAQLGHVKAKWIHGTALLYGANGVVTDIQLGLSMIKSSAQEQFKGALLSLAGFYEKGEFGFPVDHEIAKQLRFKAESVGAIDY